MDLDLTKADSTFNTVRLRIVKGLSSVDNFLPGTVIDPTTNQANFEKIDLFSCTNLSLGHVSAYVNYFQNGEAELVLRTSKCTFAGVKTLRLEGGLFNQIEELGDVDLAQLNPSKRGNLYKSLMMGGSTSLIKRLYFTNMDKDVIKAAFGQNTFSSTKFKALAMRFKDGYGIRIPFATSAEIIEFFSNISEEIFSEKHFMTSVNWGDYVFKEMSSSILAEVTYILNPDPVSEIFTASVCFKTTSNSCIIRIQTEV